MYLERARQIYPRRAATRDPRRYHDRFRAVTSPAPGERNDIVPAADQAAE
jgi:hypothetical protein